MFLLAREWSDSPAILPRRPTRHNWCSGCNTSPAPRAAYDCSICCRQVDDEQDPKCSNVYDSVCHRRSFSSRDSSCCRPKAPRCSAANKAHKVSSHSAPDRMTCRLESSGDLNYDWRPAACIDSRLFDFLRRRSPNSWTYKLPNSADSRCCILWSPHKVLHYYGNIHQAQSTWSWAQRMTPFWSVCLDKACCSCSILAFAKRAASWRPSWSSDSHWRWRD